MELKELYDKLLEEDYWPIKIYQLLFLYRFLEERGKEGQFFNFLSKIDSGYETEQLEQLIKCMTHDIPYELFIEDQYVSAAQINEMRRYLEDSQELYGETKEWEGREALNGSAGKGTALKTKDCPFSKIP